MAYRLLGFLLLFFSPGPLFAAETMFEGYYRYEHEGKHIGYSILRYSYDPKEQNFEVHSFVRVKLGDQVLQESLKGKANAKFHPLSYQYTGQVGDNVKMIDATFKGEIMTLKINDAKKLRNETHKVPKGTFLVSFLPYLLLKQKLELNEAFKYSAIAEEEGNSYWGKAWLTGKEVKPGMILFTISNKYNNEEFISTLAVVKDPKDALKNVRGEAFSVNTPSKNIKARLVASANQATEGQLVPNKILLTLFGGIPTGKINMIATPPMEDGPVTKDDKIASPVPAKSK